MFFPQPATADKGICHPAGRSRAGPRILMPRNPCWEMAYSNFCAASGAKGSWCAYPIKRSGANWTMRAIFSLLCSSPPAVTNTASPHLWHPGHPARAGRFPRWYRIREAHPGTPRPFSIDRCWNLFICWSFFHFLLQTHSYIPGGSYPGFHFSPAKCR